jgi:hypothetical protein
MNKSGSDGCLQTLIKHYILTDFLVFRRPQLIFLNVLYVILITSVGM